MAMQNSLKKILVDLQKFSVEQEVPDRDSANNLSFREIKEELERLLGVYRKLSVDVLERDFPDKHFLSSGLDKAANSTNQILADLRIFIKHPRITKEAKANKIEMITENYDKVFPVLLPYISYSQVNSNEFQADLAMLEQLSKRARTELYDAEKYRKETFDSKDSILAVYETVKQKSDEFLKEVQEKSTEAKASIDGALGHIYGTKDATVATIQKKSDLVHKVTEAAKERILKDANEVEAQSTEAKAEIDKMRDDFLADKVATKQAEHFEKEAESHQTKAESAKCLVIVLAVVLAAYAVGSFFFHKWLDTKTTVEWVQLGISKVLVFSVIASMLFLSVRNFLNHTHNAIVNKHRQNALLTRKALINAVEDPKIREVIMLEAAACIFSPQSTGYISAKSEGESTNVKSAVEVLLKTLPSATKS